MLLFAWLVVLTTFLSIIGITTLPATGHAEAKVTRTVGGVEQ